MTPLQIKLTHYLDTVDNDYEYSKYLNGESIPNVKRGMYKQIEIISSDFWNEKESIGKELDKTKSLLSSIEIEKERFSDELDKTKSLLSSIEIEKERFRDELDKSQSLLSSIETEKERFRDELDKTQSLLSSIEVEKESIGKELEETKTLLDTVLSDSMKLSIKSSEAHRELKSLTEENEKYSQELANIRNDKSHFWANFLTTNSWLIGIVAICLAANSKHLATVYQQNSPIHFQNSLFDSIFSVFVVLAYDISVLALIRNGDKGSAYFFGFSQIVLTLAYAYTGDPYISQYQPLLKFVTWLCFSIGFPFALFRFSEIFNKKLG